jgi:hypothetical protein
MWMETEKERESTRIQRPGGISFVFLLSSDERAATHRRALCLFYYFVSDLCSCWIYHSIGGCDPGLPVSSLPGRLFLSFWVGLSLLQLIEMYGIRELRACVWLTKFSGCRCFV